MNGAPRNQIRYARFFPKAGSHFSERALGDLAMSLDPADWAAVCAVGRQMVDDMLDYEADIGRGTSCFLPTATHESQW